MDPGQRFQIVSLETGQRYQIVKKNKHAEIGVYFVLQNMSIARKPAPPLLETTIQGLAVATQSGRQKRHNIEFIEERWEDA